MPNRARQPVAVRKEDSCNYSIRGELSKCAEPVATYLSSEMLDETRSPIERVQAAIGLQALQHFIPGLQIPSGGPDTSPPGVDDHASTASDVMGFSQMSGADEVVAAECLTFIEAFTAVRTKNLRADSQTLVLMEVVAALFASMCRHAQDISVNHLDADHAKRCMEELILDRTRERLRERDLTLS
jgi:hypothetical protein